MERPQLGELLGLSAQEFTFIYRVMTADIVSLLIENNKYEMKSIRFERYP